jgi:predicted SAM-dependent methyltransferase
MGLIPEHMLARRRGLSKRYIIGEGVELGALHYPLWTSQRATVRYVDRLDVSTLRQHYPELAPYDLVDVDIVDDGETLSSIEDGRLDFIIANHMLEHTENPIGTIRNHLRKIRDGGVLYYAVPDKWFGFDRERPITPFEHLVKDDQEGAQVSRLEHFYEWVRLVLKSKQPDEVEREVRRLLDLNYSIHFHVWDNSHFRIFLDKANSYLGYPFRIEYFGQNLNEVITVLSKDRRVELEGKWRRYFFPGKGKGWRRLMLAEKDKAAPVVPVCLGAESGTP